MKFVSYQPRAKNIWISMSLELCSLGAGFNFCLLECLLFVDKRIRKYHRNRCSGRLMVLVLNPMHSYFLWNHFVLPRCLWTLNCLRVVYHRFGQSYSLSLVVLIVLLTSCIFICCFTSRNQTGTNSMWTARWLWIDNVGVSRRCRRTGGTL